MAKRSPGSFYVVLTNTSQEQRKAFEEWNSWGYQSISFEIVVPDGQKFVLSKKPGIFTINFPSTFTIRPREHMVYSIALDDNWNSSPPFPLTEGKKNCVPFSEPMLVTVKAIYEVSSSPESTQQKVWTGRLESRPYQLKVSHW